MINRTRSLLAACALAAFMLVAASDVVKAQVGWACPVTTVCNLTNCTVTLRLWTIPRGAFPIITLAPGQCLNVGTAAITAITDVMSSAGISYAVLPPPPAPPCNCPAGSWSVCCVTLPPMNCCFDVCFMPATCTINIMPAACPPPCRP